MSDSRKNLNHVLALRRAATPALQGATVNCRNPLKGPTQPGLPLEVVSDE